MLQDSLLDEVPRNRRSVYISQQKDIKLTRGPLKTEKRRREDDGQVYRKV